MPEEQNTQADSHEAPAEGPTGGTSKSKIVIWVVVGVIILAAAFAYARQGGSNGGETQELEPPSGTVIDGGAGFEVEAPEGGAVREFTVSGHNFAFSDNTIRVNKGDTVKITFTSTDGFHDWTNDAFAAATERVNTGSSSTVIFTAEEAGEFPFYCSVGSHRSLGMEGKLIVE